MPSLDRSVRVGFRRAEDVSIRGTPAARLGFMDGRAIASDGLFLTLEMEDATRGVPLASIAPVEEPPAEARADEMPADDIPKFEHRAGEGSD
ncbi:hypothetical protein [Phycisphaera mikurensis]|uniref:Uncharacterized protein n=1 Tax=Phycisphaera mikurensis (strain NBRC 102666 / KCTC 22515 / FYK2301M01) TaxID=1142394 RepID=I0IFH5_PHYMF|nr:hypothetical protein [Phycisphaera mikurensis]MBB6440594.1 hypothetical protein [Phycisphaera mikurensis]BAM04013.1 hypothetical protein PSMK_18540 [Phycisphaera mikurensis NBRC 102666]